jgi:hypothetical protein
VVPMEWREQWRDDKKGGSREITSLLSLVVCDMFDCVEDNKIPS